MKKFLGMFLALALILSISIPAASAATTYPTDAGESSYRDDVVAIYSYGGLSGLLATNGTFSPNADCSERDFATMLANLFGSRYVSSSGSSSTLTQGTACDMVSDTTRRLGHQVTFSDVTRRATMDRGEACHLLNATIACDSNLRRAVVGSGSYGYDYGYNGNGYYYGGCYFTDVPVGFWCYNAVEWALYNGITSGTSATTFSPSDNITMAQWYYFLWRANKSPSSRSSCPFSGVASSHTFYTALCWAGDKGLVSNDRIDPFSTTATRSDVVWSMWKLAGSPSVSQTIRFKDVPSDSTYYKAVKWAVKNGITDGTSSTTFEPFAAVTRGAAVTMLYRCYQSTSYSGCNGVPSSSSSSSSSSSNNNNWYLYNGEKFYTGTWYQYGNGWLYNGGWYPTRNAA